MASCSWLVIASDQSNYNQVSISRLFPSNSGKSMNHSTKLSSFVFQLKHYKCCWTHDPQALVYQIT